MKKCNNSSYNITLVLTFNVSPSNTMCFYLK